MDKLWDKIKAFFGAIVALPFIATFAEFLSHKAIKALLAGLVAYALVPTLPFLINHPDVVGKLGDFIFFGTLILTGRFSIEGIIKVRGSLPADLDAYLRAIISEILAPTPDDQMPAVKTPFIGGTGGAG